MRKTLLLTALCVILAAFRPFWGFFAHEQINRMAVFTLPPELIGLYKKNIDYITRASVLPDKRRYVLPEEAPRHYLDADHYGDSVFQLLPRRWDDAAAGFGEDTLQAYGVLPWHIHLVYLHLRDAFMVGDTETALRLSADLGHYVADAHVPLHTTENYDGQLTGQEGIHGLWESRLPELFSKEYNFLVGSAVYVEFPLDAAWNAVISSHVLVARVLEEEKKLSESTGERKYSFETRGNTTVKVYAEEYARAYHRSLEGMVEERMRAAVKMTGDLWYSAWVDAGQPDVERLIKHQPTAQELLQRRKTLDEGRDAQFFVRPHD